MVLGHFSGGWEFYELSGEKQIETRETLTGMLHLVFSNELLLGGIGIEIHFSLIPQLCCQTLLFYYEFCA